MIELQNNFNTFWLNIAFLMYHIWLYYRLGISNKTKILEIIISIANFFLLRQMILWSLGRMYFNIETTNKFIEVMFQLTVFYLLQEFYMYAIHKYFHYNKFLYKWVHQMHHDIKAECFTTAMYMSPLEIIFHIFPDLMIGPIFVHSLNGFIYKESFIIWVCASSFYFIWSHSGEEKSNYMPSVKHHLDHHKYLNCNYGSPLSDGIFGTTRFES